MVEAVGVVKDKSEHERIEMKYESAGYTHAQTESLTINAGGNERDESKHTAQWRASQCLSSACERERRSDRGLRSWSSLPRHQRQTCQVLTAKSVPPVASESSVSTAYQARLHVPSPLRLPTLPKIRTYNERRRK